MVFDLDAWVPGSGKRPPSPIFECDILWVEGHVLPEERYYDGDDRMEDWKALMEETVQNIGAVHPTTRMHLILALGLKWMIFEWNPEGGERAVAEGKTLRLWDGRDSGARVRIGGGRLIRGFGRPGLRGCGMSITRELLTRGLLTRLTIGQELQR